MEDDMPGFSGWQSNYGESEYNYLPLHHHIQLTGIVCGWNIKMHLLISSSFLHHLCPHLVWVTSTPHVPSDQYEQRCQVAFGKINRIMDFYCVKPSISLSRLFSCDQWDPGWGSSSCVSLPLTDYPHHTGASNSSEPSYAEGLTMCSLSALLLCASYSLSKSQLKKGFFPTPPSWPRVRELLWHVISKAPIPYLIMLVSETMSLTEKN